jgi:hypothetical protein
MAAATLTEGDTRPTRLTYKVSGQPVNIDGYSFLLKIGYTEAPGILAKPAVIADAANGIIEFQWISTDLKAGTWKAEMLVTDAAGKEKTHKIAGLQIDPRMT